PIETLSSEGGQGEQRRWYVSLQGVNLSNLSVFKTRYGEDIVNLDKMAQEYLEGRLKALNEKAEPLGDFNVLDGTDWKAILPPTAPEDKVRALVARAFAEKVPFGIMKSEVPGLKKSEGRYLFHYNCRFFVASDGELPSFWLFGRIIIRTAKPFDLATDQLS